ncbi:hypothetical protein PHLCEN_2v12101 [Hermanssonia centrifuga]|uniref:Small nuclear ribonucleoprotein Prp3 C-terminal domain-containing protein n=1 Tax=Hermanssonia centrifuga TaxID=98765 RepID=A0A2R6NI18_9APHY|nr:hypothetical protein PHLCEN_2v12101 [Hermanssonia centrifuga]
MAQDAGPNPPRLRVSLQAKVVAFGEDGNSIPDIISNQLQVGNIDIPDCNQEYSNAPTHTDFRREIVWLDCKVLGKNSPHYLESLDEEDRRLRLQTSEFAGPEHSRLASALKRNISMSWTTLHRQLEELNLLKCSLLPGEELIFNDPAVWESLLDTYPDSPTTDFTLPASPACFQVKTNDSPIHFEVELPREYGESLGQSLPRISVKGDEITRVEQERWQLLVKEQVSELQGNSEYLVYELISAHLLPLLHSESLHAVSSGAGDHPVADHPTSVEVAYHALLTSHHLISPTKRRNLQQWSSQLRIAGFAKVGHPGVIYCEGGKDNVEEFVGNVKAMQWLALRVRFIEPLPGKSEESERRWAEFEKVGEVVEEMRRLGRGNHIVEMGIGSAGAK